MLLDSNIIIYASQAEHPQIRQFIGIKGMWDVRKGTKIEVILKSKVKDKNL